MDSQAWWSQGSKGRCPKRNGEAKTSEITGDHFNYILFIEAVAETCPGSRGEGIDCLLPEEYQIFLSTAEYHSLHGLRKAALKKASKRGQRSSYWKEELDENIMEQREVSFLPPLMTAEKVFGKSRQKESV